MPTQPTLDSLGFTAYMRMASIMDEFERLRQDRRYVEENFNAYAIKVERGAESGISEADMRTRKRAMRSAKKALDDWLTENGARLAVYDAIRAKAPPTTSATKQFVLRDSVFQRDAFVRWMTDRDMLPARLPPFLSVNWEESISNLKARCIPVEVLGAAVYIYTP